MLTSTSDDRVTSRNIIFVKNYCFFFYK